MQNSTISGVGSPESLTFIGEGERGGV